MDQHVSISINGAEGVDAGDTVMFPAIIAAEGVYTFDDEETGEVVQAYRNAEETRKMIPFCNALRLIDKHPAKFDSQFIGADFTDADFPVYGWTENAHEHPDKGPNGEVRVAADVHVMKVDYAGKDRTTSINAIREGETGNSIGYTMKLKPKKGTFAGKDYTFLETDVNPYHLGRMTDGWKPKCDEPVCGIGQSGKPGDNTMSKDGAPPTEGGDGKTTLVMQEEQTVAVATLCPDEVAKVNAGVNAWKAKAAKVDEMEASNKELTDKLKETEGPLEELEAFKKAQAEAEAEKLEGAVKAMKERIGEEAYCKRYPTPEEGGPPLTYEGLQRDWEFLDSQAPATEPEAPEPETAPEPVAPVPAQNAEAPFYAGVAGISKRDTDPAPKEDTDRDRRIPMKEMY